MEYLDTVLAFVVVMMLLSLVITTLNQVAVAAFQLRGKNLLWGVTKLLELSPALRAHSKTIATEALSHPAVVTSTRRIATAIGSKELFSVLNDLSTDDKSPLPESAKEALKSLLKNEPSAEVVGAREELARQFSDLFPAEAKKMQETLALAQKKTLQRGTELVGWFDMIMSRTTDRFVTQTRWWTMGFAIVLSLGLQIDTLDIIKSLSTDAELRASLVQTAAQTASRADAILLSESIAVEALEAIKGEFDDLASVAIPEQMVSRKEGLTWLSSVLEGSPQVAEARGRYEEEFDRITPGRLQDLGDQMLQLRGEVEGSRLVFVPNSWSDYSNRWANFGDHAIGIFLSLLLLSLGAPFWFNALQTLSSLRPILAGTVDPSKSEET